MSENVEQFVPVTDPGPQMVGWLTYLDSRLADQDRRLIEREAQVDKQFAHYDHRFDRLEDLIQKSNDNSARTREDVARNGVLATFVAVVVSLGSRYFGS